MSERAASLSPLRALTTGTAPNLVDYMMSTQHMPQHMQQQQQQQQQQHMQHQLPQQQQQLQLDYQPFMRYENRGAATSAAAAAAGSGGVPGYATSSGSLPPISASTSYGMSQSPVEAMVALSSGRQAASDIPTALGGVASAPNVMHAAQSRPTTRKQKRNLTIDIPEPTHKQLSPSSQSAPFDPRHPPPTGNTPGRYLPSYHPLSTAAAAAHIAALGEPDGGGGSAGGTLSELGSALISPRFAWSWNSPRTCSPRVRKQLAHRTAHLTHSLTDSIALDVEP